jgi:3-deoxy-7-phosphoheptulonate synthase
MLESFLVPGRQEIGPEMTYGQSVTDACMGWDTTAGLLDGLAAAVRARRTA